MPETSLSSEAEVLFSTRNCVREITLNRPRKLNAITHGMIKAIAPKLREYAASDLAHSVVVRGKEPRAFSAGADVRALASAIREGAEGAKPAAAEFFKDEFALNHAIGTYKKPYISILQGVVMGGGVGLSCHGAFRVATESTLLAMPEANIGYYPDVGSLFFLSRLSGQLGLFAALTGHRFQGFDSYRFGIATHYVAEDSLVDLQRRLEELENTFDTREEFFKLVDWCIEEFSSEPPASYKPSLSAQELDVIDAAFAKDSLEEIVDALKAEGSEFAGKTAETLLARCPLSLKATLAAYRRAAQLDFQAALEQDAVLSYNFVHNPNFVEGVLALLADKRAAKWSPPDLTGVTAAEVDALLAAPEGYTPVAFGSDETFLEYPHHFGLPTEKEVQDFVTGETSEQDTKATRKDVVDFFRRRYPDGIKLWLAEYLNEVLDRKTTPDPSDKTLLDWIY